MLNTITFEGNLAQEPDLSFTARVGTPVVELVVLVNRRVRDDAGEWVDATPTRHRVKAYGHLAEHAAELPKGATVVVVGRVETDSWEDRESGQSRYADQVIADAIGASLRFATVTITKAPGKPTGDGA